MTPSNDRDQSFPASTPITPTREIAPARSDDPADARMPAIITGAGDKAVLSFVNYFTAEIPNANTRRAYLLAWRELGLWTESRGLRLDEVRPFMVAAYREELAKRYHPGASSSI